MKTHAERCPRNAMRGFTLLEMMIAMAILAGALTWVTVAISRNIKAENHAKLMTTATFLARAKMIQTEDDLRDKGFGEFEKTLQGSFDDRGFQRFTWQVLVDKVELPSVEQVQTIMGKANEVKDAVTGNTSPSPSPSNSNPLSAGAAAMSGQFGMIKDVLEQGIRRVTVKILWREGSTEQTLDLVAYYTDPKRVDQAIQIGAAVPGTTPTTPSAPTTPGATK